MSDLPSCKSRCDMYIQITTRCNMRCAHCCFSCTRKGEDMSMEIFSKALSGGNDEYITIGGGEPTIHPLLFDFIEVAIEDRYIYSVHVITNGKRMRNALKMYEMMLDSMVDNKIFTCSLSQDQWHEPIDSRVVQAFRQEGKIHSVSIISKMGRAKKNNIATSEHCVCDDVFVKPDGSVWSCGCERQRKIGDVFSGWDYPKYSCEEVRTCG